MINGSTENYFFSEEFKNNLSLFENHQKASGGCILGSEELSDIAEYYYETGRYGKAKEAAEYAASLYPEAASPKIFLARMYLNVKKDKQTAKQYIREIPDSEKNSVEYYSLVTEYFLYEGKIDKARRAAAQGELSIEEGDLHFFITDIAHLFIDYRLLEDASQWAHKITDKKSEDYLKLTARICAEKGKNEEAISILERLIDKDPFNTDFWNLLSIVQMNADRYNDAATSSEYAIAINPNDSSAFLNKGNAYFKMCNYEKALDAYSHFSKLNDSEIGEIYKARCYFCMQQPEKALLHLHDAEKRCSDNNANLIDIYKDMAIVYGWLGKAEKAYEKINKLKEIESIDSELYIIEGGILLSVNRFDDANEIFTAGYEKTDNQEEYLFQVAVSYYEHGYDRATYLVLKEIFALDPERTRGLAYLAATCNYLGKKDEFLKYLELATKKNPEEAMAVLCELFPKGMKPYDYCEYVKLHMN